MVRPREDLSARRYRIVLAVKHDLSRRISAHREREQMLKVRAGTQVKACLI